MTILLQSATGITKCDDYYKVRQYSVPLRNFSRRPKNTGALDEQVKLFIMHGVIKHRGHITVEG